MSKFLRADVSTDILVVGSPHNQSEVARSLAWVWFAGEDTIKPCTKADRFMWVNRSMNEESKFVYLFVCNLTTPKQ